MRIVGELDAHRPALPQAIFDLRGDLPVVEIGQERESPLGYAHDRFSLFRVHTAAAVGTKSEVSVEV